MKISRAKLRDIKPVKKEVNYLLNRMEVLRRAAIGAPDSSRDELQALQVQLAERVLHLETWLSNLDEQLASLPQPQRLILQTKYGEGLSWKETAKKTHYSERQCLRLISKYLVA